jgi:uncharacterized protein
MSNKYSRGSGVSFGAGIDIAGREANQSGLRPDARGARSAPSSRERIKNRWDIYDNGRCAVSRGDECANGFRTQRPKLTTPILIGVISDTHGLLRPEAVTALRGSERIIHAGDVGAPEILDKLRSIAPVTAIRGNVDKGGWASKLPETEVVEVGGICIYVLHDLAQLDLKPKVAGFHVVISGHSHIPKQETREGVLYFNPGSAGPRRFKLPISVGRLTVQRGEVRSEIATIVD